MFKNKWDLWDNAVMESAKVLNSHSPKTKDYLAKIGEIIVLLNHLELTVEFFVWELISASGNTQAIGRRITTPLEYMEKVNLMRSLLVERVGEEKAGEFTPIYSELRACAEIRNDLAHSQWFIEYGNGKDKTSTHKINWLKAYERGKAFDFSKALQNIDLAKLASDTKRLSKTISLVAEFMLKLFSSD